MRYRSLQDIRIVIVVFVVLLLVKFHRSSPIAVKAATSTNASVSSASDTDFADVPDLVAGAREELVARQFPHILQIKHSFLLQVYVIILRRHPWGTRKMSLALLRQCGRGFSLDPCCVWDALARQILFFCALVDAMITDDATWKGHLLRLLV